MGVYISLEEAETIVESRFRGAKKMKVQPSFWEIQYVILHFQVLVSYSLKRGNVSLWINLPNKKRELLIKHDFDSPASMEEGLQHIVVWLNTMQRCIKESLA